MHGDYGDKVGYASAKSNHKLRLALDINLIDPKKGLLGREAHEEIGAYWKSLDPWCEWGGDQGRSDANHYSFRHRGRW